MGETVQTMPGQLAARSPAVVVGAYMHIDLSGRVAIVTGAGRGIGRALVRRLAAEGVTTVALDVQPDELDSLGAELSAESGVPASQFVCDVTDSARIQEVVEETVRRHGRIDILVNNAASSRADPSTSCRRRAGGAATTST